MVVESSELKDDLVRDMIEVLTSFWARLYGRRSARHQAQKAMRAIGLAVVVTRGGTISERNCVRLGFRIAYSKVSVIKHWNQT